MTWPRSRQPVMSGVTTMPKVKSPHVRGRCPSTRRRVELAVGYMLEIPSIRRYSFSVTPGV